MTCVWYSPTRTRSPPAACTPSSTPSPCCCANVSPGYIDCSPFGCRTGFHLLTWGTHSTEDVAKALKESLEFIAYKATWDDVPATTEKSCGNYRDHSLFTAKEWCKDILAKGISSDPFERKVV